MALRLELFALTWKILKSFARLSVVIDISASAEE
jgi:hypothetical protein